MEPPNKGHFGDNINFSCFVLYREVVLFSEVLTVLKVWEWYFIRGSTVFLVTCTLLLAAQLKWSSTVNTHGRPGRNISSDLHMEHLNREVKTAMSSMGANVTDQSIQRVGRAIKVLSETMVKFDQELGVPRESDYHTTRSSAKDLDRVLKQIFDEAEVFSNIPGRAHVNFPQFASNSMKSLSRKGLEQWVTTNVNKILSYR